MFAFLLALLTAVFESFKDLFSKINLKVTDEYTVALSMHIIQTLILLPVIFFTGWYRFSLTFTLALFSAAAIQLIVLILYLKAIKSSEISTSVPLITLTPVFMLITSPIILGEFPDAFGITGIVLIVLGTYLLNFSFRKDNLLTPFKNIITNKGSRYMLIVAFLWSITANIDKIGVEETSPVFWAFTKDALIMIFLFVAVFLKSDKPFLQMKNSFKPLLLIGATRTGSVVTQMIAIQFILVPYVIAIKRTSALFVILWGYFFLGEKENIKSKMIGIIVILAGLTLIVF